MSTSCFDFLVTVKNCLFSWHKGKKITTHYQHLDLVIPGCNMAVLLFQIISWVVLTRAVRTCNQCKDLPTISTVYLYCMIIVQVFCAIMSNKLFRVRVFEFECRYWRCPLRLATAHYDLNNDSLSPWFSRFNSIGSNLKCLADHTLSLSMALNQNQY